MPKFARKIWEIWKFFWENLQIFYQNYQKFVDFSLLFEKIVEHYGVGCGLRPWTPYAATPLQPLPSWTSLPMAILNLVLKLFLNTCTIYSCMESRSGCGCGWSLRMRIVIRIACADADAVRGWTILKVESYQLRQKFSHFPQNKRMPRNFQGN